MAVDLHKGYPYAVLEDSYEPKTGEGIVEGMFVKLDTNLQLVKADGTSGEYAMLAMNNQTDNFMENSGKIQVIKENGSFLTDQYKAGMVYTPHSTLQVSVAGGEEGIITPHLGGGAPIVGRFQKFVDIYDTTYLLFDLVRS